MMYVHSFMPCHLHILMSTLYHLARFLKVGEFAEIRGNIFQGCQDFEVQRDFNIILLFFYQNDMILLLADISSLHTVLCILCFLKPCGYTSINRKDETHKMHPYV